MTTTQKTLWKAVTKTEPTHLFDSTARQQILRLFVEHATFRADLQSLINRTSIEKFADPEIASTIEQMLRVRDRETKQIISLATKLRLTNQSRYSAHVADAAVRNDPYGPKPWETGSDVKVDHDDDEFSQFL